MISPIHDFLIAGVPVVVAGAVWLRIVQNVVPAPYLDEVFHVRQAENYIQGRWDIWDPKITTPPGLYLASYIHVNLTQLVILGRSSILEVLRFINVIGGACIAAVVHELLFLTKNQHTGSWNQFELIHVTLNICLFPPLFFFYALYYTDVLSALSVLFAYQCCLKKRSSWICCCAGLLSLLFRQTNIFWVSLFLGGLAFCRALPNGDVMSPHAPGFFAMISLSWHKAASYDPRVSQASFQDYVKCIISYSIAGLANIPNALQALTPYLLVLLAFVGFVFWNGGVVLGQWTLLLTYAILQAYSGDKENHVVSVHFAQMLYLWPYIVFFSIPLLYPYFLNALVPQNLHPSIIPYIKHTTAQLPRTVIAVPIIATMLTIVHYNTLIHPFTLADNRHYVFYVFRLLLRHPSIKYFVIPIYFLCAWACIAILGDSSTPESQLSDRKREKQAVYNSPRAPKRQQSASPELEASEREPRASFLLLWLLATAASVVTAPLVEPRYFIVPWLIWRIHVAQAMTPHYAATKDKEDRSRKRGLQGSSYDHRLWLETAWFLCIDVTAGYVFLYKGFEWPQEPGKVQRFMW
ncbi:glucosyltransferase [Lecanora helva]